MSSRDPKLSSSTEKRFIHFDLMIGKDARETEGDESIFETRVKLLNPAEIDRGVNYAIGKP